MDEPRQPHPMWTDAGRRSWNHARCGRSGECRLHSKRCGYRPGLLSAAAWLSHKGIVHRDIKACRCPHLATSILKPATSRQLRQADNIPPHLKSGNPVLLDFGSACQMADTTAMKRPQGTLGSAAPELLQGQGGDHDGKARLAKRFLLVSDSQPDQIRDSQELKVCDKFLSLN